MASIRRADVGVRPPARRHHLRRCQNRPEWRYFIPALTRVRPIDVAAYIEELQETHSKPTVKQHLAALRMLFDWLVIGHVMEVNPAHAVRRPKHVVKKGKTPVLAADEARILLDSIDTSTVMGLRDRALIAVMAYAFARRRSDRCNAR